MKGFSFTKGDFFGGLTAGIVALPLALAFGVQSGLGAAAGLYGAIILGFFAAVFGGTFSQISGPTGPMTVISATTITGFISQYGSVNAALGAIVACFVLAGLFQVLMGVLRIGSLIRYIPYPVISGFMSGIGVIIILLQLFPAIGVKAPADTIGVVQEIGTALSSANLWALIYSASAIAIIYIFPRITKAIPSTLIALLIVTVASVFLNKDVPVIGDIPKGIPEFLGTSILEIPANAYRTILVAALTLAALGAIDSLLTSVVADNVTKTKHNSNQELVGQGIGNAVAGFFAGIPGAGATMRTLVNIRSGGRGRWSGIIHSITLAVILLGVGQYAALIPNSVLAGVLITVGLGILDYKGLAHINKVPKSDAAIMIIVLLVTVFLDLLTAVGVGMVMASILFMKRMSDLVQANSKMAELSSFTNELAWSHIDVPETLQKEVFVKTLEGPLFFGFATGFQRMTMQLPQVNYVVIQMDKVPFLDQTGLYALEEGILYMEQRGIEVMLTGLTVQAEDQLRRINLVPGLIAENHICQNLEDCLELLKTKYCQQISKHSLST